MNKSRLIFYILIISFVFLVLPSTKSLQAAKCPTWVEGLISADLSVTSPSNLYVSGEITDGECSVACTVSGTAGRKAVADPINKLEYKFDNGSWNTLTREPRNGWWLIEGASPTYCVSEGIFYSIYKTFTYGIETNLDISSLGSGNHILILRTTYEPGKTFESGFSFTKSVPPPTCSLWAEPSRITQGQESIIYWDSTNASSCHAYDYLDAANCSYITLTKFLRGLTS